MSAVAVFFVQRRRKNSDIKRSDDKNSEVSFNSVPPSNRETVLSRGSGSRIEPFGGSGVVQTAMVPPAPTTPRIVSGATPMASQMPEADSLEEADFFETGEEAQFFANKFDEDFEFDMRQIYSEVAKKKQKNLEDLL